MLGIHTAGNCTTDDYYSYKKNVDWIQPTINQSVNLNVNSNVIGEIYAATQSDEDIILKPIDNSWFFSNEWQKLEDIADDDIANGSFKTFGNMDDFLTDLLN